MSSHVRRAVTGVVMAASLAVVSNVGSTVRAADSQSVVPFKIQVPNAVLTDLKQRLSRARFADELPDAGWDYGTNLAYLKSLVEYWRDKYDWRTQEKPLERVRPVHDEHRRGRHPLRPSAIENPKGHAAAAAQRVAELDHGVRKSDRSADRSGRTRRTRRRQLQRRHPGDARIRLLRQAARTRLRSRADRAHVGAADGASWLHALRRARQRLGQRDCHPRGARRSRTRGGAAPRRVRRRAQRQLRRRPPAADREQRRQRRPQPGIPGDSIDETADAGAGVERFTGGPRLVDCRKVVRMGRSRRRPREDRSRRTNC